MIRIAQHRSRSVAVVAALVLSWTSISLGAAARPVGGREIQRDPVADSQDAIEYARAFGVGAIEAEERLGRRDQVEALQIALSAESRFAGLYVEHVPEWRVVVLVAGELTRSVDAYADEAGLAGVQVESVKYSLRELETIAVSTRDLSLGVPVDRNVDVKGNRVEVRVAEGSDLARDISGSAADLPALPPGAEFYVVPGLSHAAVNIYAGLNIGGCTSGFTIRHPSTGLNGITTAGHCANSATYSGVNLPFRGERVGYENDSQWHTTASLTVKNWAKDNSQDATPGYRAITWRQHRDAMYLGDWLCKYGKSTGFTCGEIVSRHFAPGLYIPNATETFIQLHNAGQNIIDQGDSGGPVYSAAGAWGLVSGETWTPFCMCDLIFVATNYVESSMGVAVLTSS